jgi:hypothetical protein
VEGQINWQRVIFGGRLAGVIINAAEWVVNGVILSRKTSFIPREVRLEAGRPRLLHRALLRGIAGELSLALESFEIIRHIR